MEQHVALSVVGADVNPNSGYLRAKTAQEKLIKESGAPYTIVRATQFYEFVAQIAGSATDGNTVRLPHALMQPIAAQDVAAAVTNAAIGRPVNGITEIAGPEKIAMDDFIRTGLAAQGDPRQVVADPRAPYFGEVIDDSSIVPGPTPRSSPPGSPTGSRPTCPARPGSGRAGEPNGTDESHRSDHRRDCRHRPGVRPSMAEEGASVIIAGRNRHRGEEAVAAVWGPTHASWRPTWPTLSP